MLTDALLKLFPRAKADVLSAIDLPYLKSQGINNNRRLVCFLAQMAVECDGFTHMVEQGDDAYFARHYNGRADLGNTQEDDGIRYRGRGFIHLTGRINYRNYGKLVGTNLEEAPEKAAIPGIALKVAVLFWNDHDLNKYADRMDVKTITKRINGGYNNLQDRINYTNKLNNLLTTLTF